MRAVLVRLWTADGMEEPDRVLRGVVEGVGTGVVTPFRDERELLELLRAELEGPSPSASTSAGGSLGEK